MRLYFAYGSNMSQAQMRRRCPGAQIIGAARLDDWRFAINVRGTATILPATHHSVHGVLWRLRPAHLATLDGFEGVSRRRYVRRTVRVVRPDGKPFPAVAYVGVQFGRGRAIRAYLEGTILPAAQHFALPEDYVRGLRDAAGGTMLGPVRPHPRRRGWRP